MNLLHERPPIRNGKTTIVREIQEMANKTHSSPPCPTCGKTRVFVHTHNGEGEPIEWKCRGDGTVYSSPFSKRTK